MKPALLLSLLSATLVAAIPLPHHGAKRQSSPSPPANSNAVELLDYPFILESIETKLYQTAVEKFKAADYVKAGMTQVQAEAVVATVQELASNEAAHLALIKQTIISLGGTPFDQCTIDVSPLLTSAGAFAKNARVVEATGSSAYAGALGFLGGLGQEGAALIPVGTSIAEIEAAQSAVMTVLLGNKGIPNHRELPLVSQEVLSIVSGLLSGCNLADINLSAHPTLNAVNADGSPDLCPGSSLKFSSPTADLTQPGLFCQIMNGDDQVATVLPIDECKLPEGVLGTFAIWITSNNTPLQNDVTTRGDILTTVVAGATMVAVNAPSAFSKVFTPANYISSS